MGNIVLSTGVRQNLLALQDTQTLAEKTQLRLATGRKVNTAIDNPVNFFTAEALQNRSNALGSLMDGLSNSIQTVKTASTGIDQITKLVQAAQATIREALNDAASNRPNRTAATSLGTEGASINQSPQDTTLNKKLEGAAAAATVSSPGALGIAANSYVTISAGSTTYQFQTNSTMSVRDLITEINKSGIANATVDATGKFNVAGTGSRPLVFKVGSTAPTAAAPSTDTDGTDNLGYASADVTALAAGITASANSAVRAGLIDQFNTLRSQIGKLADDAGYNGTNLLDGNVLKVIFNEKTGPSKNTLEIQGFSISADSLGIQPAVNSTLFGSINFQGDTDLGNADEALTTALGTLRTMSSTLGANLAVIQARQDFTRSMMTTLKTGADNLVIADSNEEGANLLALQTRQQLSQTALSLASQSDQSVLKLFG